MNVKQLVQIVNGTLSDLAPEAEVGAPKIDSSAVEPGETFIALRGTKRDGHDFLSHAFARGARFAIVDRPELLLGRPGIIVAESSRALSQLASHYFGEPSRQMDVVGITGTNGKTTIHWILYHLANALGVPAARIGTLGFAWPNSEREGDLTTPDAVTIQSSLAGARRAGARFAVLEVSSHSVVQQRVADVAFDVAVFTNLTRDHLDYHPSMEEYYRAKAMLFDQVTLPSDTVGGSSCSGVVINGDDQYGDRLAREQEARGVRVLRYGREGDIAIKRFEQSIKGSHLVVEFSNQELHIYSPFVGDHNAYNLAAILGAAHLLGWNLDEVATRLATIPGVPGRLQCVSISPGVFVDYAHTPDALENALKTVRKLSSGRVWVLFGCGGDRDVGKRRIMGEIANRFADAVVVTSDNPRTEEPMMIISDILEGVPSPDIVEPVRERAIAETLRRAAPDDVVLIAGKGHEQYQIVGTERRHFSDVEEVQRSLSQRAA